MCGIKLNLWIIKIIFSRSGFGPSRAPWTWRFQCPAAAGPRWCSVFETWSWPTGPPNSAFPISSSVPTLDLRQGHVETKHADSLQNSESWILLCFEAVASYRKLSKIIVICSIVKLGKLVVICRIVDLCQGHRKTKHAGSSQNSESWILLCRCRVMAEYRRYLVLAYHK